MHLIAPGPVDSPRLDRLLAAQADRLGVAVETLLESRRAESPLSRLITPDEIAWEVGILLTRRPMRCTARRWRWTWVPARASSRTHAF